MANAPKLFAVEIDGVELGARISEALTGHDRPPGMTAAEYITHLTPESQDRLGWAVKAALDYLQERLATSSRAH